MSAGRVAVSDRGRVRIVKIDDPATRNALSTEILREIGAALTEADSDIGVGCVVLTGCDSVFAAGSDVRALAEATPGDAYTGERRAHWDAIRRIRTSTVGAVSGVCLGGGLELALGCDLILCSERSKFGLPETGLGLVPGAGGAQLLTRAVGRSMAMDMVLAGRLLDGCEAVAAGLASRAFPPGTWLEDSIEVAGEVASRPPLAQLLARESVRRAGEVTLDAGLEAERRAFAVALGSDDAREGLAAFLEKRPPAWREREGV